MCEEYILSIFLAYKLITRRTRLIHGRGISVDAVGFDKVSEIHSLHIKRTECAQQSNVRDAVVAIGQLN